MFSTKVFFVSDRTINLKLKKKCESEVYGSSITLSKCNKPLYRKLLAFLHFAENVTWSLLTF